MRAVERRRWGCVGGGDGGVCGLGLGGSGGRDANWRLQCRGLSERRHGCGSCRGMCCQCGCETRWCRRAGRSGGLPFWQLIAE
jgi:hypothetical protein